MTTKKTKASVDGEKLEKLAALAEASKAGRLPMDDEKLAIAHATELLGAGKAGITAAIPLLAALPWNVVVDSVCAAWPALKPTGRKQIVAGFSEIETEGARRLRMSLARGLIAQDAESAAKLIQDLCEELLAKGEPSPRDRQNFANVFIGKTKPWLLNLPLGEWKHGLPVAVCAIHASLQSPPFTQMGVIRWVAGTEFLPKLPTELLDVLARSVHRWPGKLKKELATAVPDLPANITEALAVAEPVQAPRPEPRPQPVEPPRGPQPSKPDTRAGQQVERPPARISERQQQPKQRESAPDVPRLLKLLDFEFQKLRNEIHMARAGAQPASKNRGQSRREQSEGHSLEEFETLRRHNAQLEETIVELRHHLDELSADHEDRASIIASSDDALAQFKALLGLKLREGYTAYQALRAESMSDVIRQSYRDILTEVFTLLLEEGVALDERG